MAWGKHVCYTYCTVLLAHNTIPIQTHPLKSLTPRIRAMTSLRANHPIDLRPHHLPSGPRREAKQRELAQPEGAAPHPPHAVLPPARRRVADHVQPPVQRPAEAQRGGEHGVAQAGDQQRREHRRLVLEVVGVRALRAVEEEGCGGG